MLTNAVSLHLELDPGSPLSLPTLKFLGADQKVAPIRDHLAENIQLWVWFNEAFVLMPVIVHGLPFLASHCH